MLRAFRSLSKSSGCDAAFLVAASSFEFASMASYTSSFFSKSPLRRGRMWMWTCATVCPASLPSCAAERKFRGTCHVKIRGLFVHVAFQHQAHLLLLSPRMCINTQIYRYAYIYMYTCIMCMYILCVCVLRHICTPVEHPAGFAA